MPDIVERYLARAWFGDLGLKPTVEGFQRVADFAQQSDLLPSTAQQVLITGQVVPCITAAWDGGIYRLNVNPESVDLEYRNPAAGAPIPFAQFLEETAAVVLARVAEKQDRQALRIAAVQELILREMPASELDAISGRIMQTTATFAGGLFEWDWRVASKVSRTFGGMSEVGNTLASLKRATGVFNNSTPFDRIRMSTDVNTEPADTRQRFSGSHVRDFFMASASWHATLDDEVRQLAGLTR